MSQEYLSLQLSVPQPEKNNKSKRVLKQRRTIKPHQKCTEN